MGNFGQWIGWVLTAHPEWWQVFIFVWINNIGAHWQNDKRYINR